MGSGKWTLITVGYMCGFAYVISLIVYQLAGVVTGEASLGVMTVAALAALAGLIYLTVRKNKYADTNVRIGV